VSELVAGSASISLTWSQPQIDSLQSVSTQPATVVMQHYEHAYETHAYLPIYFAVTLSMYTLIPTVYRALLKSAVSGTDHRIHTTKKTVQNLPITLVATQG